MVIVAEAVTDHPVTAELTEAVEGASVAALVVCSEPIVQLILAAQVSDRAVDCHAATVLMTQQDVVRARQKVVLATHVGQGVIRLTIAGCLETNRKWQ